MLLTDVAELVNVDQGAVAAYLVIGARRLVVSLIESD